MLCQSNLPQYQLAGSVCECPQKDTNGVRQSTRVADCGKCERTQAWNIMYFCKEAGVQHVDAVSEQSTKISAS